MSKNYLVAIVGRPNVGKSTFFNRLANKQISIIENEPGITRDRIYADATWNGIDFTIVDTGGIDLKNTDEMQKHITRQAEIAIEIADVVLFLVDGKEGLVSGDYDAAGILRRSRKKVYLVVNKLDNLELDKTFDFYSLGFNDIYPVSSVQNKGVADLLDVVVADFKTASKERKEESEKPLRIAIVGKPNAGKSSIINKLLGEERLVVSSVAGTTRDAIDSPIKVNGKKYILVDTAGIRKKSNVEEGTIELYSVLRSLDAIRRSDVCALVVDVSENITDQDLKIASYIHREGKPSIILMNKWDKVEKDAQTIHTYLAKLNQEFAFMSYVKPVFVSASSGQRIAQIVPACDQVYQNANKRIKTGVLNELLHEAFRLAQPPSDKGKRLKLFYATEAEVCPPTFVLFVNDPKLAKAHYLKYLENFIRKAVDFEGTPIKLLLKSRTEED